MHLVKFGGSLPKLESVCAAVLQESILGPLLFSICNSDLLTVVKHSQVHMYAA